MHLDAQAFQLLYGSNLPAGGVVHLIESDPLITWRQRLPSGKHQLLDFILPNKMLGAQESESACSPCNEQDAIFWKSLNLYGKLPVLVRKMFLFQERSIPLSIPVAHFRLLADQDQLLCNQPR
ncbi:hypothetical protein D3C87_683310 [compost metagenome]